MSAEPCSFDSAVAIIDVDHGKRTSGWTIRFSSPHKGAARYHNLILNCICHCKSDMSSSVGAGPAGLTVATREATPKSAYFNGPSRIILYIDGDTPLP